MLLNTLFLAILIAVLIWGGFKALGNSTKRSSARSRAQPHTEITSRSPLQHTPSMRVSDKSNSVSELPNFIVPTEDPMTDAVRCLKFGRSAQAIDILKTAFRKHPEALEIGLKLAELLLSTNDYREFYKVEAKFRIVTKETGPLWETLQILKTDHFGVNNNQARSAYTDFCATQISNLTTARTDKQSGYSPISQLHSQS